MENIRTRRSIRRFDSMPVENEKMERILEAGRLAPSAANKQPWHFIVITDTKVKEQLREAYDKDWFISAPAILIVCADPHNAWTRSDGEEYWKVDAAIAMQNMIVAAWGEGLGTCWIAAFKEPPVKRILNIPEDIRVVALTPLGYPGEDKGVVKDRKPGEGIFHFDSW